jgi:hypothetical protein
LGEKTFNSFASFVNGGEKKKNPFRRRWKSRTATSQLKALGPKKKKAK